jgi:hypothetical protein
MYSYFNFTKIIIIVTLGLVVYIIFKWIQDQKKRKDEEELKEKEESKEKKQMESNP